MPICCTCCAQSPSPGSAGQGGGSKGGIDEGGRKRKQMGHSITMFQSRGHCFCCSCLAQWKPQLWVHVFPNTDSASNAMRAHIFFSVCHAPCLIMSKAAPLICAIPLHTPAPIHSQVYARCHVHGPVRVDLVRRIVAVTFFVSVFVLASLSCLTPTPSGLRLLPLPFLRPPLPCLPC